MKEMGEIYVIISTLDGVVWRMLRMEQTPFPQFMRQSMYIQIQDVL